MKKISFLLLFAFASFNLLQAQAPNGFYIGLECDLSEANVTYYNIPLKIQVDKPLKFVAGSIHSSNNRNDLYRVGLEVEKVPENTWLILKIDKSYFATCLRSKKIKKKRYKKEGVIGQSKKVNADTSNSKGGFVIENGKDLNLIADFLKLDIIDRKHLGHKLTGEMVSNKAVYSTIEAIQMNFIISNKGSVPVKLKNHWKLPSGNKNIMHAFQFKASYKGKAVKDNFPKMETYGGGAYQSAMDLTPPILRAGESLKVVVNLSEWFDFNEPGEYTIHWQHRLDLQDERKVFDEDRAPEFYWDEELKGSFVLVVE